MYRVWNTRSATPLQHRRQGIVETSVHTVSGEQSLEPPHLSFRLSGFGFSRNEIMGNRGASRPDFPPKVDTPFILTDTYAIASL